MEERLAQTSEPSHLAPEMLADLLSGEIEDDDLRNRVIPHLLARCSVCRRRVEGIRRLQQRFDHWNESVVVREGQNAPRLLASLMELPPEGRLARLVENEELHTWGLTRLLLRKSREQAHDDTQHAVELAELAVLAADQLPAEAYHPDWIGDLKAQAWAVLGNARRVAGELTSAEAAFRRALTILEQTSTGRPRVRGDVLDLLASLRREQGRFEAARAVLTEAEALFRAEGDRHRVGKVLLIRAKTLEESGKLKEAIDLLRQSTALLEAERDPRLAACAETNLLWYLVGLKRHDEAQEVLQGLLDRYEGTELERKRWRWIEAHIAQGRKEVDSAESIFREVRTWFLDQGLSFDAALVSLDLAVLYAELDREEELQELASEILPLFHAQGVEREALASLLLFQQALERKTLTVGLLREVRELARRQGKPRR